MTLPDYLRTHKIPAMDFGARIGLKQPNSIYRYLRGESLPSAEIIRAIYRESQGAVTANDFFGTERSCPSAAAS